MVIQKLNSHGHALQSAYLLIGGRSSEVKRKRHKMVIHTTQLQSLVLYRRANQADHLPTNNK